MQSQRREKKTAVTGLEVDVRKASSSLRFQGYGGFVKILLRGQSLQVTEAYSDLGPDKKGVSIIYHRKNTDFFRDLENARREGGHYEGIEVQEKPFMPVIEIYFPRSVALTIADSASP